MTPTLAGRWRCGICDRPHGLIRDADACCAHAKGLGNEDMDSTDIEEARMTTELEQARKRIGELEAERDDERDRKECAQQAADDAEEALLAGEKVSPLTARIRAEQVDGFGKLAVDNLTLKAFKTYVHKRLDEAGVPADPYPEATAKSGCRIEGRLTFVLALADVDNLVRATRAEELLASARAQGEQHLQARLKAEDALGKVIAMARVQDPRNAAETYDLIANAFERQYPNRTAPGRSRPLALGSDEDPDATQRVWRAFVNAWHETHFDWLYAAAKEVLP